MTDPSDVIQTYQLRKLQDEAQRANELAEEANHLRRQQIAQGKQAPQVVVQTPAPAPKFDLAGFKTRLEKIEAETDPIFLRDLRKLEADLTASCDRHATEITSYIDRALQDMGERIKAKKALWEPLYPARAKEYEAETELRELQAIEKSVNQEIENKIAFLEGYIAVRKAHNIEEELLQFVEPKLKWPDWLIVYVGVTSLIPIDVGILADAIRTFVLESNNPKDGFPIFLALWAIKLIVGLAIGFAGRARGRAREREQIQTYLTRRAQVFEENSIPRELLQSSHNDRTQYIEEVLNHEAKAYGVGSVEDATQELETLMKHTRPNTL